MERSTLRAGVVACVFGLGGLVIAWVLALVFGTGVKNATILSLLSAGSAAFAGILGAGVLHLLRRHSTTLQLGTVALTSVVGVAAGTFAAGYDMFLSPADARDMVVILIAAGTVGMLISFLLSRHLVASTRALIDRAGALEDIADQVGTSPHLRSDADVMASHAVRGSRMRTRELDELRVRLDEVAEQLRESEAKRRALEASRRELVAWVSHDLRTPLAGLRSLAEALEDGLVDDEETVSRYLATMLRQVDELTRLVDDLFELSRIQSGVLRLDVEPVSLDDLLSDAVSLATPIAETKGVVLRGFVAEEVGEVEAATPEFLRVLQNLLDNAIRHTPPSGEVTVEAGRLDGHAYVSVRDTCGGIPGDEIDRVFELAFRGDEARSHDREGGAGLGLAIAQGLITAQKGHIEVRNDDGGCRFTVTVPLAVRAS